MLIFDTDELNVLSVNDYALRGEFRLLSPSEFSKKIKL